MSNHAWSRLKPASLLLMVASVASLLVGALGIHNLEASRRGAATLAEVQSRNLAQAIDRNLTGILERIDLVINSVISELGRCSKSGQVDQTRMAAFITSEEALIPMAVAIRVTDAQGKVIFGNATGDPSLDMASIESFRYLKDHPEAGLFLEKPAIGVFTKKWVIRSARRYNLPNGRFGGIVVIPVLIENLRNRLAGFDTGPNGTITLRDIDGGLIARHPNPPEGPNNKIGNQSPAPELRNIIRTGLIEATYFTTTPFDGVARIYAARRIQGGPLRVGVGFAEQDYLALWRRGRALTLAAIGAALLVIWFLAWSLWTAWRRQLNDAQALLESEARFRTYVEQSIDVIFSLNSQGIFRFVSPAWERHFGYSPSEVLGKPFGLFVHPDDVQQCAGYLEQVLTSGVSATSPPYRVRHMDGSWLWFRANGSGHMTQEGELALMAVAHDITERKRAEEALRESEVRYRTLFDSMTDAFASVDMQGRIISFNQAFMDLLSRPQDEILGQSYKDITPPRWREIENGIIHEQVLKRGYSDVYEKEYIRGDGTLVPVELRTFLTRDAEENPISMSAIIRDITDRKQMETALQKSERRLFLAISATADAIWEWNLETGTTYYSPRWYEMLGLGDNELPMTFEVWKSLCHPDDFKTTVDQIQASIMDLTGSGYNLEFRMRHREGSWIWVLGRGNVVERDGKGRARVLSGTNTDITDRKQAEEERARLLAQLQQSQKMESLGTLAGGVAHDINNVLGAILGLASAHIRTQPSGSPLHRSLSTICKATERGGKMVQSLLSFARQSPAENNSLDMNGIVRGQVALLERTTLAKVHLEMDLEANLRPILGDASALSNALMNICVNAVDAMPDNGTLTLHTHNVENGWIELVVKDNGMGMPKEVLERAMEPFFTTKETGKGTGLGLSMVFSTVKAHRGQLAIESEPGKGTRVYLRFPASDMEAPVQAETLAVAEASDTPHRSLKVLVVDDDELIQNSVQVILECLGYTVVSTVPSGEEALTMLEGGLEADLVILDMNMPGLGGMGTLPRLRALRPELPVMLSTGRVDQGALTIVSTHSGVTLLPKPYGLRELQESLQSIGLG